MNMHRSGPERGTAPHARRGKTVGVGETAGGAGCVRGGRDRAGPPGRPHDAFGLAVATVLVLALAGCAWPGQAEPGAEAGSTSRVSPSPATPPADPSPSASSSASPPVSPSDVATAEPSPTAPATPTPTPEPPAQSTPTPAPEPEPTPEPTPTEPPAPQYPQRGSTGPEVTAVQQRLQDLGYFLLEVDGSYGWATSQAVWAFQKAAGLGRDGVVGPKTQAALDAGYRPTPRSSSGKVVEIDLDRQILMAVENGQVVRIINASSGNGERYEAQGRTYRATTPRGEYSVYMQRDGMHSSTLELGDMWRPKYFTGGYAVHGSSSIPPYPASHGCVRVSNAAMNWLWDSWGVPVGTRVLVY